jgi:hypothetical protein
MYNPWFESPQNAMTFRFVETGFGAHMASHAIVIIGKDVKVYKQLL